MKKKKDNKISIVPFLAVMIAAVVLIFAVNRAGQEEASSFSSQGIQDTSGAGISDLFPDDTQGTGDSSSSALTDSSASGTADTSSAGDSGEVFSSYGYHYDQLNSAEQAVYSEMLTALQAHESRADVNAAPESSLTKIYNGILFDHPEIFWVDNGTSVSYTASSASDKYEVEFEISGDSSEIDADAAAIEAEAAPVIAEIDSIGDEYDKVARIYEYLAETTEYNTGAEKSQNIRSTFLSHETVCAGYSLAFKYLCDKAGIPCVVLVGVGDGDFHECNLVNVGGIWGYVDVTWGDTDDDFVYTHAYLGLTSDEMQRSGHTVTDGYSYPSVTGTGMDYFRRNNILYGALSADKMSEIIGNAYLAGQNGIEMKFDSKEHYMDALAAIEDGSANGAVSAAYQESGIYNYRIWYQSNDDLYVIKEIWQN